MERTRIETDWEFACACVQWRGLWKISLWARVVGTVTVSIVV